MVEMKKIAFVKIVSVLFFALIMNNCKKENCECTTGNLSNPESETHSIYYIKGSKKKKEQLCSEKTKPVDNNGNYTTCVIK